MRRVAQLIHTIQPYDAYREDFDVWLSSYAQIARARGAFDYHYSRHLSPRCQQSHAYAIMILR